MKLCQFPMKSKTVNVAKQTSQTNHNSEAEITFNYFIILIISYNLTLRFELKLFYNFTFNISAFIEKKNYFTVNNWHA